VKISDEKNVELTTPKCLIAVLLLCMRAWKRRAAEAAQSQGRNQWTSVSRR